jgi:hypothetical protein
LSAQCGPVHKEQQLAGLATTPSKANIAGAPRLSCVKKDLQYRFGEELPYLFDNSSLLQDSILLKPLKRKLGGMFLLPLGFF